MEVLLYGWIPFHHFPTKRMVSNSTHPKEHIHFEYNDSWFPGKLIKDGGRQFKDFKAGQNACYVCNDVIIDCISLSHSGTKTSVQNGVVCYYCFKKHQLVPIFFAFTKCFLNQFYILVSLTVQSVFFNYMICGNVKR